MCGTASQSRILPAIPQIGQMAFPHSIYRRITAAKNHARPSEDRGWGINIPCKSHGFPAELEIFSPRALTYFPLPQKKNISYSGTYSRTRSLARCLVRRLYRFPRSCLHLHAQHTQTLAMPPRQYLNEALQYKSGSRISCFPVNPSLLS